MNLKLLFKKNVLKKKMELECGGRGHRMAYPGTYNHFHMVRNGKSSCLGQGNTPIAPILPLGYSILINSSSKLMERKL